MTILTNLSPAASYGDLITCNNNGQGLTSNLQNIQDGFGNNSAIQLSTTTLNVIGTFQVGGVSYAPIVTVSGTLSSAQILALYNTPITVIATPGAANAVVVTHFSVEIVAGATPYAAGGHLYLQYGTTAHGTNYASSSTAIANTFVQSAANTVIATDGTVGTSGLAATSVANTAISITNDTALFTTGNGTLNYYITYYVMPIS